MYPPYRDQLFRAKTEDLSSPSLFSRRSSAVSPQSEPDQETTRAPLEPQEVSGLTKAEAEDLLDWLEAAGYEGCEVAYVPGEGFRVRLPFGSKRTTSSDAGDP